MKHDRSIPEAVWRRTNINILWFYTSNNNCIVKVCYIPMFNYFKQAEQLISKVFPEKIAVMDNILQVWSHPAGASNIQTLWIQIMLWLSNAVCDCIYVIIIIIIYYLGFL